MTPGHLDFDRIDSKLYQGSAPPWESGSLVRDNGFDVLVLCAQELEAIQRPECFPGVLVVQAGFDDADMTPHIVEMAGYASSLVAQSMWARKRCLVTCAAGINRSGLVSALSLRLVSGRSGEECMRIVQEHRHGSLRNTSFQRYLRSLPSLGRGRPLVGEARYGMLGYRVR